jgi:hypothetical protein
MPARVAAEGLEKARHLPEVQKSVLEPEASAEVRLEREMTDEDKKDVKGDQDMKLRTPDDLSTAQEWLLDKQQRGQIDARSVEAMNTTLKGAQHLIDTRLKVLEAMVQMHKARMPLPVAWQIMGSPLSSAAMVAKIRSWQTTIERLGTNELSLSEIETIMDELNRELREFKPSDDKHAKALPRTLEKAVQATKSRLKASIPSDALRRSFGVDCAQPRRPDAHE